MEQEEKERAIEIVDQYRERNPSSLPAEKLCLEFANELEFRNERTLQACLDYAKMDSSDGSIIDRIMELLPECLLQIFMIHIDIIITFL